MKTEISPIPCEPKGTTGEKKRTSDGKARAQGLASGDQPPRNPTLRNHPLGCQFPGSHPDREDTPDIRRPHPAPRGPRRILRVQFYNWDASPIYITVGDPTEALGILLTPAEQLLGLTRHEAYLTHGGRRIPWELPFACLQVKTTLFDSNPVELAEINYRRTKIRTRPIDMVGGI